MVYPKKPVWFFVEPFLLISTSRWCYGYIIKRRICRCFVLSIGLLSFIKYWTVIASCSRGGRSTQVKPKGALFWFSWQCKVSHDPAHPRSSVRQTPGALPPPSSECSQYHTSPGTWRDTKTGVGKTVTWTSCMQVNLRRFIKCVHAFLGCSRGKLTSPYEFFGSPLEVHFYFTGIVNFLFCETSPGY